MKGAIFLDRDGTINRCAAPHEYILHPEDFHFLDGALDALAYLDQNSERQLVIVTNQPAIGKGLATEASIAQVHVRMMNALSHIGCRLPAVYLCPHAPWEGCECRKPKPGLLLKAAMDLDLDLSQSVVVGDTGHDLQAGWAAGVPECYQVMTGAPLESFPTDGHEYETYATLMDAAQAIVRKEQRAGGTP